MHVLSVLEPVLQTTTDPTLQSLAPLIRELFRLSREADVTAVYDNSVVRLPVFDTSKPLQGWGGTGRITLIGDAAHAMRPASGQGGSMAFEDAYLLCRKLEALPETEGNPSDNVD